MINTLHTLAYLCISVVNEDVFQLVGRSLGSHLLVVDLLRWRRKRNLKHPQSL